MSFSPQAGLQIQVWDQVDLCSSVQLQGWRATYLICYILWGEQSLAGAATSWKIFPGMELAPLAYSSLLQQTPVFPAAHKAS